MKKSKLDRQDVYKRTFTDYSTGEVISEEVVHGKSIYRHTTEEDYIKLYYNTFLASLGEGRSTLSPLLIAISRRMTYSDDGQVVYLMFDVKDEISKEIGISVNRINQLIRKCVDLGILLHKKHNGKNVRGAYIVSPFLVAKGSWKSIHGLQLKFNAQLEELEITPLAKPKYITDAENKGFQLSDPESDDSDSK